MKTITITIPYVEAEDLLMCLPVGHFPRTLVALADQIPPEQRSITTATQVLTPGPDSVQ